MVNAKSPRQFANDFWVYVIWSVRQKIHRIVFDHYLNLGLYIGAGLAGNLSELALQMIMGQHMVYHPGNASSIPYIP